MAFKVGDEVVYPMHGAGIIGSIEQREILNEIKSYYILDIPYGKMQVMVPVDKCKEAGLRAIVEKKEIKGILSVLGAPSTPMEVNWNRRLRENNEKLKTGDPKEVASVIRNLTRVEKDKKLSAGEKKLLTAARQILSSEIALVLHISSSEADDMIDRAI